MKIFLFLLNVLLLFSVQHGLGQDYYRKDSMSVTATILDQESAEPLSYATVYNLSRSKGTISNLSGIFSLDGIMVNDTLIISYIGYKEKMIIVAQSMINRVLYLQPNTELLKEIIVYADNSFLYDLLTKCKKSQTTKTKIAKTYYVLNSTVNKKQVELVECYYNGEFSGYDTKRLDLKNGRLALSKFHNWYFVSTESSKAMYLHKIFAKNDNFPVSPFQLKKGKLKQQYDLSLVSKYLSDDSKTVYVVDFIPVDSLGGHFNGRVWIDSLNKRVIKVNLQVKNARIHPFVPYGNADSLMRINMRISKTFKEIDNIQYVNSIELDYQLTYETEDAYLFTVNTDVILYAYDYFDHFPLPKFDFSPGSYEDYRKINASPYNHFFWDNIDEFGMKEVKEKSNQFIKNTSTITSKSSFQDNSIFEEDFLEQSYLFWNKERIQFNENSPVSKDYIDYIGTIPSQRYNLEAQIYLDVNQQNDSLNVITKTIFDPFKSYFRFPLTNNGKAFINMYFDLVEIYRRGLEEKLRKEKTVQQVMSHYDEAIRQLEKYNRDFLKETERGTNIKGMLKWNDFIKKEIGIDNLAQFNIN